MKLIMAIINDEDSYNVMDILNSKGFSVTKLASTGGFLRSGNTTLIAGVPKDKVKEVTDIIEKASKSRKQVTQVNTPGMGAGEGYTPFPVEVNIGGATIFVLDIDEFIKV